MKERWLVVFTLLLQMVVGAFLVIVALYQWVTLQKGPAAADHLTFGAFLALVLIAGLGLLSSFFHLGTPGNAWRAFANLRASWLSREILFATGFTALGALFVCSQWFELDLPLNRTWLAWIVVACGLALVFSMAHVYMLPTITAWKSPFTLLSFFTTTLLLGGLGGAALSFAMSLPGNPVLSSWTWFIGLRGVAILAIFFICLEILVTWATARSSPGLMPEAGDINVSSPRRAGFRRLLKQFRLLLVLFGGVLAVLLLFPLENIQITEFAVYGSFALVLLSEVLGRILFYEAH